MAESAMEPHPALTVRSGDRHDEAAIIRVREALSDLRYGQVTVVVQDGVVVQIERTEKLRLRTR